MSRPAGGSATGDAVRRSVVLENCIRLVFHAILATSLFFLFSGHNAPGGGFIGGLVAGSALVLRYLGSGRGLVREVRVGPTALLGSGLLVAGGTAVAPLLLGGQPLESTYTYVDLPVIGDLPLASVLSFDTGVFLIVVGIVLAILTTLGSRRDASLSGSPEEKGDVL